MLQKNIRYSYSFLDKFAIETKIPNSNDVILKSRDSEQLILMKQIEVTAEQYQQTLATLDYQKKLSHEQLLALVDYYPQPSIHKFVVLYEYCSISLMDQFENRLAQRRIFSEPELWSIFTSLVFGLAYLEEQNVGHGSISLSDCFLNEQGFIKVSDPTCATSNPYTVIRGYFYAPQILRCLIHDTGQQINIFKSDAFSLGLCMVQLSLMRDVSEIFDYEQGKINHIGLKCLMSDFASVGLSKQYVNFILTLLNTNPYERPDFVNMKAQIFSFLALDTIDQTEQNLRNSYGIKSSISSLCRSKQQPNIALTIKQPKQQLQTRKIKQTKSAVLNAQFEAIFNNHSHSHTNHNHNHNNETSSKKNRPPLGQLQSQNKKNQLLQQLPLFNDKPNVDYLFGNMKKSIHLGNQDGENQQPVIERKDDRNQKRNGKLERSKEKIYEEITHLQDNIQKIQFNLNRKRRLREESTKVHQSQWSQPQFITQQSMGGLEQSKMHIIKKQLQLLFPESTIQPQPQPPTPPKKSHTQTHSSTNISQFQKQPAPAPPQNRHKKSGSAHPEQARKSQILLSYHQQQQQQQQQQQHQQQQQSQYQPKQYGYRMTEEVYTDPGFLRMMKADVQQILSRRKWQYAD